MNISASSCKNLTVDVDVAVATAIIYSTGESEEVCKAQATELAKDIVEQYLYDFDNVVGMSVELDRVRCIDGKGIMSTEHRCTFEIHQKGKDLFCSLSTLEAICCELSDIRLIELSAFPSPNLVNEATNKVIIDAYNQAEYEAKCIVTNMGKSGLDILNVSIKDIGNSALKESFVIPDPSNADREVFFDNIHKIFSSTKVIAREVTVVLSC